MSQPTVTAPMRFFVDAWDPAYGTSLDPDLDASAARVVLDTELPEAQWHPIDPDPTVRRPTAILFVDGVRRIDARVWVNQPANGGAPASSATPGLCASYAAGAMCCCNYRAHLIASDIRRGLFTTATHADHIDTTIGTYLVTHTHSSAAVPLTYTLSIALQARLAEAEIATAVTARTGLTEHGIPEGDDILVVDGPLHGRQHLPRAIGYIKTHHTEYLPPHLNAVVSHLKAGQRTPVFRLGTTWDRHSWYLRLPCASGAPWAGIVRVECSADLVTADAVGLANLSQPTLCRYASTEYKDPRAPQNLYPIGGLERQLRRRLGDNNFVYRALTQAAAR